MICATPFGLIAHKIAARYFTRKLILEMKACEKIPPRDDANHSAHQMIDMLRRRMCKLNIQQKDHPKEYIRNFGSFSMHHTLSSFILMAHTVGCEVVLRSREDKDIENNPEQTDAFLTGKTI